MSDVAVIGAGYVGLTTAVCLAHLGHAVVCADIDADRVDRLNKGEVPILEDGLPELLTEGLGSRRLRFVLDGARGMTGRGGRGGVSTQRTQWVQQHCTAVDPAGYGGAGRAGTLYDCRAR